MAILDSVLQAPVPSRQVHANHSGKTEIEGDDQGSAGFEDVMAQSGNKDEVTDTKADADKTSVKPSFSKASHALNQFKLQLSEKNQSSVSEVKETVSEKALVDALKTSGELIEKTGDLGEKNSPANVKKIEVMDLSKGLNQALVNTGSIAKPGNASKEIVDKIQVGKIQLAHSDEQNPMKLLDGSTPEKQTSASLEVIDLVKTFESTEIADRLTDVASLNELAKPLSDKKAEGSKSRVKKEAVDLDQEKDQSNGVKNMLDILGSSQPAGNGSVDVLKNVRSKLTDTAPEANATNVLQAISSSAVVHGNTRTDAVEARSTSVQDKKEDGTSQVDPDLLFRFSKPESADKSVELKLGLKDKLPDGNASQAQQSKVENIVVLESRRYLALAPDSNAFNLVSRIAGDKELSHALTSSIIDTDRSEATSKVVNTLKLQMNPQDLGTITATLRLRGEELSVAITVQNSAAYNHLASDQDKMIDALRAQGFAVDQVSIQFVNSDRSAFQDQQQPQSNGQAQQQARDGASAQQGRQQGNGTPQNNNAARISETGDAPSSNASRTNNGVAADGQVYV